MFKYDEQISRFVLSIVSGGGKKEVDINREADLTTVDY